MNIGVLLLAGRHDEAELAARDELGRARSPLDQARARHALAEVFVDAGRLDEAATALDDASRAYASATTDPYVLCEIRLTRARYLLQCDDLDGAAAELSTNAATLEGTPTHAELFAATLLTMAQVIATAGSIEDAAPLLNRACSIGSPMVRAQALLALADAALASGDRLRALELVREGVRTLEERELEIARDHALSVFADLADDAGDGGLAEELRARAANASS